MASEIEYSKAFDLWRASILVPRPIVDWCMQNLSNLKTVNIGPGIHLLQEDNPHFICQEIVKWYDENNLGITASHFELNCLWLSQV